MLRPSRAYSACSYDGVIGFAAAAADDDDEAKDDCTVLMTLMSHTSINLAIRVRVTHTLSTVHTRTCARSFRS